MGYRTVRDSDLDSLYRRKEGTQYFLFITNIVMLLVGLANFCVCIWIRSADDIHKRCNVLCRQIRLGLLGMGGGDQLVHLLERHVGPGHNNTCSHVTSVPRYVVMVVMVLHALNSLLSAYGAFSESRALLIGSLVLR